MKPIEEPAQRNPFTRSQSSHVAKRTFEREATLIRRGWIERARNHDRLSADAIIMAEHPDDWMQRHTYRMVRRLIACGHSGILNNLVGQIGTRHGSRHDISKQPFKQALLVMSWWREDHSSQPLMDRRRRAELGDAMQYALLHRVPPKYLCAFAKYVGLEKVSAKLKAGHREVGFKSTLSHRIRTRVCLN